jgi:hypothetical protein
LEPQRHLRLVAGGGPAIEVIHRVTDTVGELK